MKASNLLHIGSRKLVPIEEILYLQSDLNYTKVFTTGPMIYSSTSLKIIENRMAGNPTFLRINKGLIVNIRYVKSLEGATLVMKNNLTLSISRRRMAQLFFDAKLNIL
jgi:two-component system LytT family response regulator